MSDIYNKNDNLDIRRKLRLNSTKSEIILWQQLRNKRFLNLKFKRQYGIDNYIVDFYCPKFKLAIEIDGGYHLEKETKEYDQARQEYLEDISIVFLRFTNKQIINELKIVLKTIAGYITDKTNKTKFLDKPQ
ncbi:MAG: hypothetical protein A3J65_02555 [Candidatus Buchananbacteria bacterium RIFCSPHIGHO2_02_FULL_45_11b]|uniref:DUF559 domain-containing protein n=2 Tax=Candidatus Buchananiibacteriota TaxID=1817903 RepID=A0A1G1YG72_9BACT|nr:MAG: hypothetical protein A3J65_02555 [Candidatus Buchananbacteria bacterium RIFCSPHIGHO2_02_FULL_45_11b]OGY57026.1 MAG: hypothetical protein A3H67_00590 [Candidatus Buchananbacteria bacterium RIFCSPLOWO2_02_FULL_46_11b]